jgi:hypothetical protein
MLAKNDLNVTDQQLFNPVKNIHEEVSGAAPSKILRNVTFNSSANTNFR